MNKSFKLNLFFDQENILFEELIEKLLKEESLKKIKTIICD